MSILSDYAYNDFGIKLKGRWYHYYIFCCRWWYIVILLKRRQESKWFLGSFILQLIGIGHFISSIVINYELLIGPQMDSLTLPIFLYLIGVNLIEISGLIAYSTQEMSRGTFPWKIILGNILLIAYFNYAVFFYH